MVQVTTSSSGVQVSTSQPASVASIRIKNSDESFDVTTSDNPYELADINIGSLSYPAAKDLTWNWGNAVSVGGGIGYSYPPPTGQSTSFLTGDDAYVETNTFTAAVRLSNGLKPRNWLAVGSFITLVNNNAFGNTNRFTDDVGAQNYDGTGGSTANYFIDHLTGIGWSAVIQVGSFNTLLPAALTYTLGVYGNFFVPNENILKLILRESLSNGFDYSPLNLNGTPPNAAYITSTTYVGNTSNCKAIGNVSHSIINNQGKGTGGARAFYCRKHF